MSSALTAEAQKRGRVNALIAQCFGAIAALSVSHGIMLLYLTRLGISKNIVVSALALPSLLLFVTLIPAGFYVLRVGLRRMGVLSAIFGTGGFFLLLLASFFPAFSTSLALLGLAIFGVSSGLFIAQWLPLLQPVLPSDIRGRFFGVLRSSWQFVGILFTASTSCFLNNDTPVQVFQTILIVLILGLLMRQYFLWRIPCVVVEPPLRQSFPASIGAVFAQDKLLPFTCYVFLLVTFTAGCPVLFAMTEKSFLHLNDQQIVTLGNAAMIGAFGGYFIGGRAVDRFGTRIVFLGGHFGFALVIFLFLSRGFLPLGLMPWLAMVHFLFGMVSATTSLAITSELLGIVPAETLPLSNAFAVSMMSLGAFLSGSISAWMLSLRNLSESWSLWGREFSNYDSILIYYGGSVLLVVVTLGLVPSVVRRAGWIPQGH
ncbi:MAG: MFS transporter [Planctomycetes bacterium]|nr:MFS transporter [Planctomycetota bacterium]